LPGSRLLRRRMTKDSPDIYRKPVRPRPIIKQGDGEGELLSLRGWA
jgi:hypothetical protein